MNGLSIEGVVVRYGPAAQPTTAVDQVTLQVPAGQVLALLGPSGCGKSSLLRAIAGLEPLGAGRICWDGTDLVATEAHQRGFGLMFQDGQLFAHRDVGANIAFGLQMSGMSRPRRRERVGELLELVGLAGYGDRAVASLSGGEAQRVSLARALAPSPRLLLLDEPLSALDRALRERLGSDLHTILRRTGTTALYVTHDQDEAFTVADRVAVMMAGQIVQDGTPAQLWSAPADAQIAAFFGYRVHRGSDGQQVAVAPQALVIVGRQETQPTPALAGDDQSEPAHVVGHHLTGTVQQVGFSRGRTTVQVDLDDWGSQHAVAPGIVDLEPGQRIQIGVDPSGVVRL